MAGFCGADSPVGFLPVAVLEAEGDHLMGTSSQASQQHQEGSMAQIDGHLASREGKRPLDLLRGEAVRYGVMGPLPWGKSSGFQARSAFPTEDEKSQEGSHGGTREFASTPVFVGSFLLHKI
jgi:hypothetical protein